MVCKVAILAPMGSHSGNRSTALRIQGLLNGPDCDCLLSAVSGSAVATGMKGGKEARKRERYDSGGPVEDRPATGEESVASWAASHGVEVLVALHALVYKQIHHLFFFPPSFSPFSLFSFFTCPKD